MNKSPTQVNEAYAKRQHAEGRTGLLVGEFPFPERRYIRRCQLVLAIEGNRVYLRS